MQNLLLTVSCCISFFGWCSSSLPFPRLFPLWHFTDTIIIILLSRWTNVFWPFTAWRHAWRAWGTSFVIFTTPINTTTQATSPTFLLRFTSFMVIFLPLTVFDTFLLRGSDICKFLPKNCYNLDRLTSYIQI